MASEPLAKARAHLGEVVDQARHGGQATILTDHGKPAAVIISHEMYEEYRQLREKEDKRIFLERLATDTPPAVVLNDEEELREFFARLEHEDDQRSGGLAASA